MKIKMLVSRLGCNDGKFSKMYKKGEIYEVSDALGFIFLGTQVAVEIDAKGHEKMVKRAPLNKAITGYKNKGER